MTASTFPPPRAEPPPPPPLPGGNRAKWEMTAEQEIRASALAAAAATLAATAVRPLSAAEASTRQAWVLDTARRFATFIETGDCS